MAKSASVPPDTDRHGTPRYVAQRYRLDTPIGRGGAGVVWRGEDELLQRPVAIKEILVPMAGAQNERDAIRARVLREARALARLHSPAIVSVYDVVEEHQRHWIVMELVDADSLGDVIRNHGPLPFDQVAAIGLALTDALAAAHSAGVLHRDVKPGNVLLGRDGRVRLTDFGIAATEGDVTLTGTGALVGSPAYIAPERVRGSSGSPASDLWGLGATLYSAVEGQPPFEGPETYAVLTAVVEGRRRAFRLAGPLRNLLSDLMDRPAEERPDVTEIRRRLIPVARNANPVPASVMHARSRGEDDEGPSAADVGLENLDDAADRPAQAAPGGGPATGGAPGPASAMPRTGPDGRSRGTGPRADAPPLPAPVLGSAAPGEAEITADPVVSSAAADETTISPATGGGRASAQAAPPRRTGPQAGDHHDAHTQVGMSGQATGAVRGGADDETRIGTLPMVGAADLGLLDDDHAAGLVPLDEARRRADSPPPGGPGDGWRQGDDAARRRRMTIAIAAGAVVALAGAIIALATLSGGGSSGGHNDVGAQETTAPPTAAQTVPSATLPAYTAPVFVTPDAPRHTPRRPRNTPTQTVEPTQTEAPPSATATVEPTPSATPSATSTSPRGPSPSSAPTSATGKPSSPSAGAPTAPPTPPTAP
ncbi:Serine/threonine protein kinase [Frankia canadensis]|uniref:non-specific serine/threonine protein kinase n=1 Tax=Frankia canadensis TaxID=1836972 RepID=A0A2I2KMG1_9ACTN|nr:serine/threonine-protein kinase [Frankia canadensis]SNQ46846.1 Serine/threonine protein kinase [Frankia canadensis]SOU54136.1 Serine/threonine protein kinase [Frankia canadensis]